MMRSEFISVIGAVLAVGGAFAGRQIQAEFQDWTPKITDRLTGLAVVRLPKRNRERYAEEWSAHLAEVPGQIGKWWVAIGFLRAARKMQPVNLKPGFVDLVISRLLKETLRVQLNRGLPPLADEGWIGKLQTDLIQRVIWRQVRRLLAEEGMIVPKIKLPKS